VPSRRPRITVLNSSEDFLALIDGLLEDEGPYDVTTDTMDDSSIGEVVRSRPELVIADVVTVEQDADRLLRQLLDAPELREVKVIVTSPASPDVRAQLAPFLGETRVLHLPKPFTSAALEELVARLLPGPDG
jgi:CheY-like chemotaxis protein